MEGKAIRFAPGQDGEPIARFWKVWAEGNEIYASSRSPQGLTRISVHASGQIHYRLRPKLKQDLAPLMQLGDGPWFHAFEIRFLLSQRANAPRRQRESLNKKTAYLISVPEGFVLYANLIVACADTPLSSTLPTEFLPAGRALWRVRLRDHIKYLRETLKPTVTFSNMPRESYVEVHHPYWSPDGGNVVLVVPMGDEAARSEEEVTPAIGLTLERRKFRYQSSRSTIDVIAPDGQHVAVLEFDEVDKEIELIKNQPSKQNVGTLKMRLEPSNLIVGSKFMTSPSRLVCVPSLGGASPRNWEYLVFVSFDGFSLSAEVRQISTSLRNTNLTTPISELGDREELLMTIPYGSLKLIATIDSPATSTEVPGRFLLRDSSWPGASL